MRLLAIDTALGACSAAILDTNQGGIIASASLPMLRGHAEALMPLIRRVMDEAGTAFRDLDRVVVTTGPGSFTGLRVGIAAARGFAPSAAAMTRNRGMLTTPGSTFAASMLRDIERGAPTEADHILGDLIRRGDGGPNDFPLLRIAYAHLRAYEARRKRENSGASPA